MSDVDLLIRPGDLERVEHALGALGYRRIATSSRHVSFMPAQKTVVTGFGEHEDNVVPIEVHSSVMELLPVRRTDITETLWPARPQPGLSSYADNRALMLHLLLHAAGNFRKRTLRHIQLHDIALLAGMLDAADWHSILRSRHDGSVHWWIYVPLAMTERYYEGSILPVTLRMARRNCPLVLRYGMRRPSLAGFSFSNLRIPAFPGLTWSQTPMEALRFMRSRIAPSRSALQALGEGVDANPRLKQLPWYDKPHAERIFRWMCGRAPRVQTVLSVREAIRSFGDTSDRAFATSSQQLPQLANNGRRGIRPS
jgi:hypothetical protein